MKKIKSFSFLAAISTLFMGCPYSSEVPIENASIKIDTKLLGKWELKSGGDDQYDITKGDDFTYNIDKRSKSNPDVYHYKGYLSDVNGTKFFNLWEDGASTKTYYLYKFTVSTSGSKIILASVTENIDEKFTTSAELKKFIQSNMELSFFYTKTEDEYIPAD